MNRRGFCGVVVGAALAPFRPKPAPLQIPVSRMRLPPLPNFHETYRKYRAFAAANPLTYENAVAEWYDTVPTVAFTMK